MTEDVRWRRRYENYRKELQLLEDCMPDDISAMSEVQRLAATQAFENVHELGWKLMRDFLRHEGFPSSDMTSTKAVIRIAFNCKLIDDGQTWMNATQTRSNTSSHVYNERVVQALMTNIHGKFLPAFRALNAEFQSHYEQQGD